MLPRPLLERYERLESTRKEMIQQLSLLNEKKLNQRNDGWSALQNLVHLITAEELSLRYVKKKLSFNPPLKKATWSTALRYQSFLFSLNLPINYKAPSLTNPEEKDYQLGLLDKKWNSIRKEMIDYLKNLDDALYDKAIYKHPFAGRLSLGQMLHFFEIHQKRHFNQIKRSL